MSIEELFEEWTELPDEEKLERLDEYLESGT